MSSSFYPRLYNEDQKKLEWELSLLPLNTQNLEKKMKEVFDTHLSDFTYATLRESHNLILQNKVCAEKIARENAKLLPGWFKAWIAGLPFNKRLKQIEDRQKFLDDDLVKRCNDLGANAIKDQSDPLIKEACENKNLKAFSILTNKMKGSLTTLFQAALRVNREFTEEVTSPNLKDAEGKTLLQKAIEESNAEIVKMLLHKGANANQRDAIGRPMLQIAIEMNNPEMVQILLNKGAERNQYGLVEPSPKKKVQYPGIQIEPALIGGDPNQPKRVSKHLYQIALDKNNSQIIELLTPRTPYKDPAGNIIKFEKRP